jgi:hypothetical protein
MIVSEDNDHTGFLRHRGAGELLQSYYMIAKERVNTAERERERERQRERTVRVLGVLFDGCHLNFTLEVAVGGKLWVTKLYFKISPVWKKLEKTFITSKYFLAYRLQIR